MGAILLSLPLCAPAQEAVPPPAEERLEESVRPELVEEQTPAPVETTVTNPGASITLPPPEPPRLEVPAEAVIQPPGLESLQAAEPAAPAATSQPQAEMPAAEAASAPVVEVIREPEAPAPADSQIQQTLTLPGNAVNVQALRKEFRIRKLADGSLHLGAVAAMRYDLNSPSPRAEDREVLDRVVTLLKDCRRAVVHVVGHADSSPGTVASNQRLSKYRAARVANYLIARGVPAERIRHEGRGRNELLVKVGADGDRSRNRRVDIVVKPVLPGREQEARSPPLSLAAP